MNYYETLYIVHSALESGRLKDIVLTVEKFLKENGGEPVATEIWGKKKLGYFIDKQKYGTYILLQFKSDGMKNNNFNVEMEHNPSILAYMTVRIEEDGIREQTEDLDTQIAGKEAKTSRFVRVEDKKLETVEAKVDSLVTEVEKAEEIPAKEVVTKEAEAPVEDTSTEETLVESEENTDSEATEVVAEEAPADEVVAEEASVEEVVVEKTPAKKSKEETVVEEASVEADVASEEKVEG
jgi:ribosomal protein S6